jgi:hypothetical protein
MTELIADNRTQDLYNADPAAMVGKLMDLALNNLDCNECTKAAYGITKSIKPNFGTGDIDAACGANFTGAANTPSIQIFTGLIEYSALTATLNTTAVGINHTALAVEFTSNGVMGLAMPSLSLLPLTMFFVFAVL